jgi:glycine cleavage system aminomethyltransferase T
MEFFNFMLMPTVGYNGEEMLLRAPATPGTNIATASQYTGWEDEVLSWKNGCYLGTSLSGFSPTYKVTGPGAVKFFRDFFVNSFENFPAGRAKHGIMCRDDGIIMNDGMMIHTREDEYLTNWLNPYIQYCFEANLQKYDAVGENITGQMFLYQIAGPTSLQILERASGENLHDIKFFHCKYTKIAGHEVLVLRMGMAGTLAYEVHGAADVSTNVYNAIWGAGQNYGMKKLGQVAYMCNHTEDGFPQANYHFPYPWYEDQKFAEWLDQRPGAGWINYSSIFLGSMGPEPKKRYRNPVELGWGGMIKFDHDFVGKEALQKLVGDPNRVMVTLEWNADDVADVFRSQFDGSEQPYQSIEAPNTFDYVGGRTVYIADQVLADGKLAGISSGRCRSIFYHRMISLCSIEPTYAKIGTAVTVIFGDEGNRQKEIRAKVARFPYLQEERNPDIDVSKIPHGNK